MNNFLAKLEKKYGRYAIKNLIIYVLAAYGIGYVLLLTAPAAYSYLELNPALVMKGQVWRLITWVCTVPESFSFFILFMFMFQYFIGSSLEKYWGSFRYNCYVFSGIFYDNQYNDSLLDYRNQHEPEHVLYQYGIISCICSMLS